MKIRVPCLILVVLLVALSIAGGGVGGYFLGRSSNNALAVVATHAKPRPAALA